MTNEIVLEANNGYNPFTNSNIIANKYGSLTAIHDQKGQSFGNIQQGFPYILSSDIDTACIEGGSLVTKRNSFNEPLLALIYGSELTTAIDIAKKIIDNTTIDDGSQAIADIAKGMHRIDKEVVTVHEGNPLDEICAHPDIQLMRRAGDLISSVPAR